MRILVLGGSSFIGAHLCRLGRDRHTMLGVHHRTPLRMDGVVSIRCDLARVDAVEILAAHAPDAIVHLAFKVKRRRADRRRTPDPVTALNRRMMDVALALDKPLVYASSTVVHWPRPSAYASDRREDEARVRRAGRPWAILRPCAPYGPYLREHTPAHKESFHTLAELVRRAPVIPIVGDGRYRRQPIHVDDFNGAILALLERGLPDEAYDAGGATALTFDELVAVMARGLHRRWAPTCHLPKRVFASAAHLTRGFDHELMALMDTDDVAEGRALAVSTGVWPRSFAEGVQDLRRRV